MTVMRWTAILLAIGVSILFVAVIWWWLTYRDVIQYAYLSAREASVCLVGRSDICELARSLCNGAHPATFAKYWWGTFWIGFVFASISLTIGDRRQA
jgi:hypothetical protein